MVERHVDTFNQLGFKVDLSDPSFPQKAVLSSEILKITEEKTTQKWIVIAPFAQYDSKVYPQDLMGKVIEELASETTNKIFLFGGGNKEIEILNSFSNAKENVINVAGKLKK
jgi:ADP-heptose:LPS heptosyltransferase